MRTLLSAALAVTFWAATGQAATFTQMFVFGDSLSDNGNVYLATGGALPAPPAYTTGKFTDGPDSSPASASSLLWHEVLAGLLGVPGAAPFLIGGTNYAVGGANALPGDPVIPSIAQQIGLALGASGGVADPNALYVLWGGANDLYTAADQPGQTAAGIAALESSVATSLAIDIQTLAAAGAKNFLWLNLPNLGATPRGGANPLSGALTSASAQFQSDVAVGASVLSSGLNVKVATVDVFLIHQIIQSNPAIFGMTNVTSAAQGAPVNPDQYLFWDQEHPTSQGHLIIGLAAQAAVASAFAVPEPATWAAACGGMLVLAFLRRRSSVRS